MCCLPCRQVMEEGERLSKKQLAQESTIKKLRVSSKEVAAEKSRLEAQLAQDQGQLATTRHALETANASLQVPASCSARCTCDAARGNSESEHCSCSMPHGCHGRRLRKRTGPSCSGRSSTMRTCCRGRAPAR